MVPFVGMNALGLDIYFVSLIVWEGKSNVLRL
jgi:hypothetical protein